jgi:aryl-alcohol dehydrogenase-like predicted oxidoreductase
MQFARKPLQRLYKIAGQSGRSVTELALVFVRDLSGVNSLILGMETKAQITSNFKLMKAPALTDELNKEIQQIFGHLPEKLLNPVRWPSEVKAQIFERSATL